MNEIFAAFTDPTVISSVILAYVVQLVFKYFPPAIRFYFRGTRCKELRKVKNIRRNPDQITFESIKANTYFLLFMGCSALFLVLVTMGPLKVFLGTPSWVILLVFSPVFITEIMWLNQSYYAKKLIEYRAKLRVTSCSKIAHKQRGLGAQKARAI